MSKSVFHVVPSGDGWAVRSEGAADVASSANTKPQALRDAERLASKEAPSRIVVHDVDGTIEGHRTVEAPSTGPIRPARTDIDEGHKLSPSSAESPSDRLRLRWCGMGILLGISAWIGYRLITERSR